MSIPGAIRYEQDGAIATFLFDRPKKLNAFTRSMAAELLGLFDRTDADDDVRAVILTGAGRAFCAGADLSSDQSRVFDTSPPHAEPDWNDPSMRDFGGLITLRMFRSLKPIIVAFNGPAAGIGVTMTLAADYRLASTTAKFALPFTRRGIVPESAASWFLPHIVGIAKALEWTIGGATFPADEALAAGLVRSLHAPQKLLPAAKAIAHDITDHTAPVSVALTRQMLWRALGFSHPMEAHRIESRGIRSRAQSADVREGVESFLEKRSPRFPDRVSNGLPEFFSPWKEGDIW